MINDNFIEHQQTISRVAKQCSATIATVGSLMVNVLQQGSTIYWCENGGSAHLAHAEQGRVFFSGQDKAPGLDVSEKQKMDYETYL